MYEGCQEDECGHDVVALDLLAQPLDNGHACGKTLFADSEDWFPALVLEIRLYPKCRFQFND